MHRTTFKNLLNVAARIRPGETAVAATWSALHNLHRTEIITVFHNKTAMFEYDTARKTAVPLCVGKRTGHEKSMATKILYGAGFDGTFDDVLSHSCKSTRVLEDG